MKKLVILFVLVVAIIALGCNSDDDGPSPFVIVDDEGVLILLEWSTGSGLQQAIDNADLDMDLILDNNVIRTSASSTSFEEITFEPSFPNGNYDIDINYFSGEEAVDFTVFVNPISGENQNFVAAESFSMEQAGGAVFSPFLNIIKVDSTYTISRIN